MLIQSNYVLTIIIFKRPQWVLSLAHNTRTTPRQIPSDIIIIIIFHINMIVAVLYMLPWQEEVTSIAINVQQPFSREIECP